VSQEFFQGKRDGRFRIAVELALAAGDSTLKHFYRRDFAVEKKADRSPVTVADKEAETLIRQQVHQLFPDDAVLGEEFGEEPGTSDYQWIIDPIDGTKSFITGVPLYSTLVAVTLRGEPLIGVINMPALRQIVFAMRGDGAWTNHPERLNEYIAARVSNVSSLAESVFVTTQNDSFERYRDAASQYRDLESQSYVTRTWGDGYGYYLVATGRAEYMVDPIVNAWDVAAVMPVVLEAGGEFTDWNGQRRHDSGHAVGSNGHVHQAVISALANSRST
jgi:histidinol phosphatase-like enzyme (inositol monophosphatase family)